MTAASSVHGLSSPSAAQHLHDPVQLFAGVQDTVYPLDHWPGPSQHSWPTLHSPVDDISSWVTSTPLSKRIRHNEGTSQWGHLTLTTTSVSCNSLRANINWVWTCTKDTANSHLNVCIWKILRWGRELENSHVSVCRIQHKFQILYCFFSEVHLSSGRRPSACLFVYRALSPLSTSRMRPSISRHYPPPLPTYQFTQFTKSRPSYLLNKH